MEDKYLEEYIPVDLHVHTPASSCYKTTEKDIDTEYIKLLQMYVEKGVNIIAITDHNTIKGYKEILRIKSEVESRVKFWKEIGDIEELREKLKSEEKKAELFEKIKILPGIEFEAFPGIHILLVFNPEIEGYISTIEKFLEENGYPIEVGGQECVDVTSVSAVDIVNKAYDLGAITMAAHVDSDKGALDKLKDSGRVQFLKNNSLNGVQIVKPETIDYLKNLMLNKEYEREKNLSYMRFSDFHNKEEIDGKISFFRLRSTNFDELRSVIVDHPELISFTPRIEDVDLIDKVVKLPETITFENIKENNIEKITECICAIFNRGKGNIVIGIGNKGSISGIKKTTDDFKHEIDNIIKRFNKYIAYFKYTEDYYELGETTVGILRFWSIGHVIFDYKDSVYIFNEKSIVKKASINDIFELGEKNYKRSFVRINQVNQARVKLVEEQMEMIGQTEENIELNRKILKYSVVADNVFEIDIITKGTELKYETDGLGIINGNIYHASYEDSHFPGCYNRITCSNYQQEIDNDNTSIKKWSGERGIINSRFATHYIEGTEQYYIDGRTYITFSLNDFLIEQYSMPALILWMKSPILMYHLLTVEGNYRLISPRDFYSVPIILHENMKKKSCIDNLANEMINCEKNFLLEKDKVIENDLNELMDEHNNNMLNYVYRVEEEFAKMLGISKNEYSIILDFAKKEEWGFFDKNYSIEENIVTNKGEVKDECI